MKTIATRLPLILAIALSIGSPSAMAQAVYPVQGLLVDHRTNSAAPGLMVSLIHPQFGRSAPSYSNAGGGFGWTMIQASPQPYMIEVYWGNNLIYRQPVTVNGPMSLGTIVL